ncbi:hypothetical protein [Pseudonocardia sp. TMWB2A]
MLQVNIENVMKVYQRLNDQVRNLRSGGQTADQLRIIPPCGQDPVSLDAVTVFQPKIDSITRTHTEYVTEVVEARDRLKSAAQEYGLIEDENAATLKPTTSPYNGPLLER